jgi:hypothetical protein
MSPSCARTTVGLCSSPKGRARSRWLMWTTAGCGGSRACRAAEAALGEMDGIDGPDDAWCDGRPQTEHEQWVGEVMPVEVDDSRARGRSTVWKPGLQCDGSRLARRRPTVIDRRPQPPTNMNANPPLPCGTGRSALEAPRRTERRGARREIRCRSACRGHPSGPPSGVSVTKAPPRAATSANGVSAAARHHRFLRSPPTPGAHIKRLRPLKGHTAAPIARCGEGIRALGPLGAEPPRMRGFRPGAIVKP